MLNKAILIGRLTKEPELKSTGSGVSVLSFTLAVTRNFKQDGEYRADFINCVAYRRTAEFISQYFGKGDMMSAVGEIQTRTWEDNEGKKHYVTEVVVSDAGFVEHRRERENTADEAKEKPELPEEFGDIGDGITGGDDLPF